MSLLNARSLSGMDDSETALARAYISRIARLRKGRGMTQAQMAAALGISLERYKKYEQRSVFPPYLLARFSAIVATEIEFIVTGRKVPKPRRPSA